MATTGKRKSSIRRRRRSLAPMMASGKDNWRTPAPLVRELVSTRQVKVDLAASKANAICRRWFGPGHPDRRRRDYLTATETAAERRLWAYCNPPYSRAKQPAFIEKCARRGFTIMLLPARTDTKIFHRWIWDRRHHRPRPGVLVEFIEGRLKFVGAQHGAPFPSMLVIFTHPQVVR